ncbi:unnamed protein product [Ectocarpus fasciculatus]
MCEYITESRPTFSPAQAIFLFLRAVTNALKRPRRDSLLHAAKFLGVSSIQALFLRASTPASHNIMITLSCGGLPFRPAEPPRSGYGATTPPPPARLFFGLSVVHHISARPTRHVNRGRHNHITDAPGKGHVSTAARYYIRGGSEDRHTSSNLVARAHGLN